MSTLDLTLEREWLLQELTGEGFDETTLLATLRKAYYIKFINSGSYNVATDVDIQATVSSLVADSVVSPTITTKSANYTSIFPADGDYDNFPYDGCEIQIPVSGLAGFIAAGKAKIAGVDVEIPHTAKTFTASKDTYVDVNSSGTFTYIAQTIGAAAPAITANSIRLAKVVTGAANFTSVTDLRNITDVVPIGLDISFPDSGLPHKEIGFAPFRATRSKQKPWTIPFPAVIALKLDDGQKRNGLAANTNWWTTATATFAIGGVNKSPSDYMSIVGFPISMFPVTEKIGTDTDYMSWAEINLMLRRCGGEIGVHSHSLAVHNDTTGTLTDEEIYADIREAKYDIAKNTGLTAKGFCEPGPWVGRNSLDSASKMRSGLASIIQKEFEYSTNYVCPYNSCCGVRKNIYGDQYFDLNVNTTADQIAQLLEAASTPGCRTVVLMHTLAAKTVEDVIFKALIDGVVEARRRFKLAPVTMSALMQAELLMDNRDSTGVKVNPFWGGLPLGKMDSALAVTSYSATLPTLGFQVDANSSTVAFDTVNGAIAIAGSPEVVYNTGDTVCLSMTTTGASQSPRLIYGLPVEGGRTYQISFLAKNTSGGAITTPIIRRFIDFTNPSKTGWDTITDFTDVPSAIVGTSGYSIHYITTTIPRGVQLVLLYLGLEGVAATTKVLLLDSCQCFES